MSQFMQQGKLTLPLYSEDTQVNMSAYYKESARRVSILEGIGIIVLGIGLVFLFSVLGVLFWKLFLTVLRT